MAHCGEAQKQAVRLSVSPVGEEMLGVLAAAAAAWMGWRSESVGMRRLGGRARMREGRKRERMRMRGRMVGNMVLFLLLA